MEAAQAQDGLEPVELAAGVDGPAVGRALEQLAKRGKLPGFRDVGGGGFEVDAHAHPFDHTLAMRVEGGRLVFALAMKRKLPAIFGVAIVLAIFPGVWLTDSMLATYFSWYRLELWQTALWYLPLTVLPLPWMLARMVRKSRAEAIAHAGETRGIVAGAVGK